MTLAHKLYPVYSNKHKGYFYSTGESIAPRMTEKFHCNPAQTSECFVTLAK